MSINICEEDLMILVRSLIKEKMTEKILYYSPMIDFTKYPNFIIELADYFQSIDDNDMTERGVLSPHKDVLTEYYYRQGLNFPNIRSDALAGLAAFFINNRMEERYQNLEKEYQFDEQICIKLATNISKQDMHRAIELLHRFPSWETYDTLRKICGPRNHSGCYIQTNLILAKKYYDKEARKQILNNIKFSLNNYIRYIDHYSKTPEILKCGYEGAKLFGYVLTIGKLAEKCNVCGEKNLQTRSVGWDECFVRLECKHYLCQKCCYDKMDENTCLVQCPCGNKSTRVFNLLLNNFDDLSIPVRIN